MGLAAFFFYVFACLSVLAGAMVIVAKNPVHAVLFLILAFFNAAGLFVLLGAEFLAMLLVIVYVGAVAVLFLFVVMMLDINIDSVRKGFWRHMPLAGTIGVLIALEMAAVLMGGFRVSEAPKPIVVLAQSAGQVSNTRDLGVLLYSEYVLPVQIAAVILLVAIIAAIALTLRERKDSKHIGASEQIRVRSGDRVRLVKLDPTRPAEPPAPAPAPGSPETKP